MYYVRFYFVTAILYDFFKKIVENLESKMGSFFSKSTHLRI